MSAPHVLAEVRLLVLSATVTALALLAACADQSMALQGTDTSYAIVFFDSGSTSLSKQAKEKIADLVLNPAEPVKAVLKPDSTRKVCVNGHSDNTGPETANVEVGRRRAEAVAKYLVELGVPQQRIVVRSLGSSKPMVVAPPNTSEVANRRVEVVFSCPQ
jgi:outer membrane protein OmpA-like peptidoglycan-associated protein